MCQSLHRRPAGAQTSALTASISILSIVSVVFLTVVSTTEPCAAAPPLPRTPTPPPPSAPALPLLRSPVPPQPALVNLFPELANAPAPDWLRPGTRVTYRVLSASTAETEEDKSASGSGLMQYDLVHLDETTAVSSVKFWIESADGSAYAPSFVMAGLGIPGAGDYWVNPQALKNAEKAANDTMSVGRTTATIEGKAYQAARFQYQADNAEYVWMFEESSGLLIFYRQAIGKADDTQRQLSTMSLVGRRQIRLPWREGTKPAWVRTGSRMNYMGTYTVRVGNGPATALAYTASMRAKQVGDGWALYQVTTKLAGQTDTAPERVTGALQLTDALWLPAQALKSLTSIGAGVVDKDPATGVEIRVVRARSGGVTLRESGALHRTELTYDRQGRLTRLDYRITAGLTTTHIELALTGQP